MESSRRENTEYQAAQMYYGENRTMQSVATELGVSRSTVSRLLDHARRQGIVRISLHPPMERTSALEHRIRERYGVRAHVAASSRHDEAQRRNESVAVVAAGVIDQLISPGITVAVAWGQTMTTVVPRLSRREVPGMHVVQLNGAVNSEPEGIGAPLGSGIGVVERFASAYSARSHVFAVPAFFDYEDTKRAMWRERSTRRVLDLRRRAQLAVFGVGTFSEGRPSQVYSGGYLSRDDLNSLTTENVVGDICTVFLRSDGTWEDIELNRRASGPEPTELKKVPQRVCVVNGPHKVPALRGAMAADLVTDLVLDQVSADRLAYE